MAYNADGAWITQDGVGMPLSSGGIQSLTASQIATPQQLQQYLQSNPSANANDLANLGYQPIDGSSPGATLPILQKWNPGGQVVNVGGKQYYKVNPAGGWNDVGLSGSFGSFIAPLAFAALAAGGAGAFGAFGEAAGGAGAGLGGGAGGLTEGLADTVLEGGVGPTLEGAAGGAVDTAGTMGVDLGGNVMGDLSGMGSGEFVTPQMLTQAVQDGTLTQAQASSILQSLGTGGNPSSLIQQLTNQGMSPSRVLSLAQQLGGQGGASPGTGGTNTNVGGQGGFGDILSSALNVGGQLAPGLLALNYASNQPAVDTSQLMDVYNRAGMNMPAFQQAAIDPLRQTQAAGYGDILQSQAVRGVRGSSFGDSDIANYLNTTNRGISNAGANATQQSLNLQGNLAGQITNYNMLGQQQKNDMYGRALGSFGQGLNPTTAGGAVGGGLGSSIGSLFGSLGNYFGGGGGIASGPQGYPGGTIAGDANMPGDLFGQGLSVTRMNNPLPTDYSNLLSQGFL